MIKEQDKFNFKNELKLLDKMYSEISQAIFEKPDLNNIEEVRLYVDNSLKLFNDLALNVKDLKNSLIKNRDIILETWNPPA